MRQKILRAEYIVPCIVLGIGIAYIFYLSRDYIWVIILLGVVCADFGLRRYFERITPKDKFHLLHPWKIPNPARRRDLWLLASFNSMLHLPMYIAIAVALALAVDMSIAVYGVMLTGLTLVTCMNSYQHMRRQYRTDRVDNGSKERGDGLLYYEGPSDLSRREVLKSAVIAIVLIVAYHITLLAWLLSPLR